MAVAFDAVTEGQTTTTDPFTFTHTPVSTPRGVALAIYHLTTTDLIDGAVTYGGVALTRVITQSLNAGEPGRVYWYFVGSGLPTGAQTVSIAHTGSADAKIFTCFTFTGSADLTIVDSDVLVNAVAAVPLTLDSGAATAIRLLAIFGEENAPANITLGAGLTAVHDHDFGASSGKVVRETTPSAGATALQLNGQILDHALIGIAIAEGGAADQNVTPTGPTVTVTSGTVDVPRTFPVTAPTVTATPGAVDLPRAFTVTGPAVTVGPATATVVATQVFTATAPTVTVTPGTGTVTQNLPVAATAPTVTVTAGTATVATSGAAQNVTPTAPTVTVGAGAPDLPRRFAATAPTVTVSPATTAVRPQQPVTPIAPTVTVGAGTVVVEISGAAQNITPTGPVVTATAGTATVTTATELTATGPTVTVAPAGATVTQNLPIAATGASVGIVAGTASLFAAGASRWVHAEAVSTRHVGAQAVMQFVAGAEVTAATRLIGAEAVMLHLVGAESTGSATLSVPPGFDPSDLGGLTVWLDASQLGLADGAAVATWPNLGSGADPGFVATPAPVVRVNALNGLRAVRFKPGEGRLRGDHGLTGTLGVFNFTLIYVTRMVGPGVGRIFSATYPGANYLVGFHTSAYETMYDNSWVNTGTAYPPLPTPWKMYGSDTSHDGTNYLSRFFINGVVSGTVAGGVGLGTLGYNISGYETTGPAETCDCEVAELLIYNRKLPDAERIQVETYLQEKWGLT